MTFVLRHAAAALSITVGVAIPGFFEGPLRSLEMIPEILTLFVLLGLLLSWCRQGLIRQRLGAGEEIWQGAFSDAEQPSRPE